MMSKRKVIVSLSGGLDSATVLTKALADGLEVVPVSFTYGSKHNQWELRAAELLAKHYSLMSHYLFDLTSVMANFKSALLKSNYDVVPDGHYEAENMRQTVVPG